MFKRSSLYVALAAAVAMPGAASAMMLGESTEATVHLSNRTAIFTGDGQTIGQADTTYDTTGHDAGDLSRFENKAKIFLNGSIGEDSSWHAELQAFLDTEGVNADYKYPRSMTQSEILRELYVDTTAGNWNLRLGKQQVVWGTADGIKLLDVINPTDWRYMVQDPAEDARIPVWMINADTDIGDSGNFQVIISQVEENKIPGLNENGDDDHLFIMKGVDTLTGDVNGFMGVIPNLTNVATSFTMGAAMGMFGSSDANPFPSGDGYPDGLVPFSMMSVDSFAGQYWDYAGSMTPDGLITDPNEFTENVRALTFDDDKGFVLLNAIAQQDLGGLGFAGPGYDQLGYGNNGVTNLMNESGTAWLMTDPVVNTTVGWNISNPVSAFEYMPNASFATFNNSAGNAWFGEMMMAPASMGGMEIDPADLGLTVEEFQSFFHGPAQSAWVRDYPDDLSANFGMRFRNSLDNGLNFSLNYFYAYDGNPSVGLICRDSVTGEVLQHELRRPIDEAWFIGDPASPTPSTPGTLGAYPMIPNYSDAWTNIIANNEVGVPLLDGTYGYDGTIGVGYNSAGQYYGAFNPMTGGMAIFDYMADPVAYMADPAAASSHSTNGILMTFNETLERVHNIGASFDYALETSFAPVVLRGEFLYKKDERHPVVDKRLLGIGYFPEAFKSEKHDVFKYVLGADVTVMTNMLVSAQFIQFRNLDYVNEQRTCTTQTGQQFDCSKYTADMATMHMTNGLQRAEKNKEFVSLFFSKPFGESQLGRWNNILMWEENGGYYDQFSLEYSLSDNLVASGALSLYWGDENTQFGQLKESSTLQVGLKYIIE